MTKVDLLLTNALIVTHDENIYVLVPFLVSEESGFINGQAINMDGVLVFYWDITLLRKKAQELPSTNEKTNKRITLSCL